MQTDLALTLKEFGEDYEEHPLFSDIRWKLGARRE